MESWIHHLVSTTLAWLSLPAVGLPAVFVVAFVSATLLPLGSEPVVFALVKAQPELFWPAVLVATAGNTLGGALTWWMGYGAHRAAQRLLHHDAPAEGPSPPRAAPPQGRGVDRALAWLQRHGAPACLLSWLPIVGDPLCAVAGWLRLPFWPCLAYMAVGKLARYIAMTVALIWAF